jgi:tryptophanyl-tRNA synthetase
MHELIDPWGSGDIKDYQRLVKEFGISPFSSILGKVPSPSMYMKRGVVYGDKDYVRIIDAMNKKEKFVMITGLMPSGKFHLGHKLIAEQMVYYQELGAECFITAADLEAYLTRDIPLEKGREIAIEEYLVNYIALGLKPKNCHFYFQSKGKKEYNALSKMIAKRTTLNEMAAIYGELSPAKITAALTQVADILHVQLEEFGGPRATVVPVGSDQLPHINLTRDIAARMKNELGFIMPSATFNKFMPGLQGGKMSSSKPESYVALTDDAKTVRDKVMKHAFSGGRSTIEEHRKLGGNPDIDVSYQWLTFFEEDDKKLKNIYDDYKSGKLLTGELKQILVEKLTKFLEEHNKKREKARKEVDKFLKED